MLRLDVFSHRLTLAVLFALGLAASMIQLVLVREFLVVFAGNELTLGAVYAGWFVGIFAGATLASALLGRVRATTLFLILAVFFLAVFPLLAISGLRTLREIFSVEPGRLPGLTHLALATVMFILPAGALLGLAFPLLCRVGAQDSEASMPGRAYVWESAGSILGGVLVGLVLAGRWPSLAIVGLGGGLLALLTATLHFGLRKTVAAVFSTALGVVLVAGLATRLWFDLDRTLAEKRFSALATGAERIAWRETPYHFLDLGRSAEQYNLYGDGKLLAVFPDPYQSTLRANLILAQHPQPKRVLILGTASFGLVEPMLRHPLEKIDLVEIDPGTINLAQEVKAGLVTTDGRVSIHHTDGRRFLRETQESWDIIFSDAPDPLTVSTGRFYTLEFFRLVRSRLAAQGVFATRLSSSPGTLGESSLEWLATVECTLRQVFSRVLVLPGEEALLLASDADVLLDDPSALAERFSRRGVNDPGFSLYHFSVLVQKNMVDDLAEQLKSVPACSVSTDEKPAAYLLGLRRWLNLEGERGQTLLSGSWWWRPLWWWLVSILAILIVVVWIGVFSTSVSARLRRFALTGVLAVGSAGMALELVLLYAWQSWLGSLYRELGLLMAAFMAGIVGGGALAGLMARSLRASRMLVVAIFGLGLYCLVLPFLLDSAGVWAMAMQKTFLLFAGLVAGAFTGTIFAVAGRLQVEESLCQAVAAARLEAADHLGAAAGAFFTGLVFLPVLGRAQTCWLFSATCMVVAAAFWLSARRRIS